MPGSSNTSFIPKRNPGQVNRNLGKRKVYIGTLVVNVLFVSAIIASVAVYLYQGKLNKDLDEQISLISSASNSFNEAELVRIQSVDKLLHQANFVMDQSASFVTVLESLEKSIVDSARIEQIQIVRTDENIEVEAKFSAADFDSVLFQQSILASNQILNSLAIENLVLETEADEFDENNLELNGIKFEALIGVNSKDVPRKVMSTVNTPAVVTVPVAEPDLEIEEGRETDTDLVTEPDNNQEII